MVNYIDIYADGACSSNPGPGGFGVFCEQYGYLYGIHCEETTNNREELKAIIYAFEFAQKYPNKIFLVHSDSKYCVNICNDWIFKWAKNDWQRHNQQQIENLDLIQNLYNYLTIDFFNCQVIYCKGHSGIPGNELVDAVASGNINKFHKIANEQHYDFVDGYVDL